MTETLAEERSFDKARRKMVKSRIEFLGHLAKFGREELVNARLGEQEWSPLEIAYHLYLTEGVILEQMRRVQSEDNPTLPSVESAKPRIAPGETALSLENVLASLAARREETFEYLSELSDEVWLRPLHHEDWGDLKFYQLVNALARHDQAHTEQLIAIREQTKGEKTHEGGRAS